MFLCFSSIHVCFFNFISGCSAPTLQETDELKRIDFAKDKSNPQKYTASYYSEGKM